MNELPRRRNPLASAVAAALVAALAGMPAAASARGFADLWRDAQQADAQFQAARYELEAARFEIPIARSALLPQVSISTGDTLVNGTREQIDGIGSSVSIPLDYTARTRALSLRMPILNMDARARLNLGEAQVSSAEALYEVRRKDLATRLGRAYFVLLFTLEGVALAQAEVTAYEEALAFATRRLRGGEGTRTEVSEAEGRLDIARAELIAARDQEEIARRSLQVIVGVDTSSVVPPPGATQPLDFGAMRLEDWIARVDAKNPEVLARRTLTEVARREVKRAQAGHYPTLNAVASASLSENDSVSTLNTRYNQNAIGLQLNIPIYTGGFVSASTDQAQVRVRKTDNELEAELNTQRVEARRQYLAVVNGLARIDAYEKAVRSSEVALEGTRFGVRAGTRTNLDVLNAQRQIFESRRDLAQARYTYLQAALFLQAVAGDSLDDVVESIDRALKAPRSAAIRTASSGDGMPIIGLPTVGLPTIGK